MGSAATPAAPGQPVFYYDLGSPACYLAAERITARMPVIAEWEPVSAARMGLRTDGIDRSSIERLAAERGLQPIRWPATWPPDTSLAALAATYAKHIGRVVAFSLACFRQGFAGGRDLGEENTVLIAAAACEMHPTAVLKGVALRSIEQALTEAGLRALRANVCSLPAIQVGERVFEGDDAIEAAATALGAAA